MSTLQLRPARARKLAPALDAVSRRRLPASVRLPLACALLTLAVGTVLYFFGPPGVDRAAHVYHTTQFEQHGWRVWNNYWYAGRYELLNYSILFYPMAAIAGIGTVVLASLAAGTALFATIVQSVPVRRGRVWPALAFAISWPATLISGQYPFMLGSAFAMAAILALIRHHAIVALGIAALTALTSPLAFLLLTVVLAGLAVGAGRDLFRRPRARLACAGLLLLAAAEVLVLRLFPVEGRFPFGFGDLAWLLLFVAVGLVAARSVPVLRGIFLAYGLAATLVWFFPSGVGGNFERLADYWASALLLLAYAVRPQPMRRGALLVLAVAVIAQAVPIVRMTDGGLQERADKASFWSGAVQFLTEHADPNHRVEVVSTWGHWESYHLAQRDIPLTRGWFRQDDFPINLPLYDGALDPANYQRWISSLAVQYVVLPRDELDYSSRKEAEMLALGRGSLPFLRFVHRDPHVDIYQVIDPTPLLTLAQATGPTATVYDQPTVIRFDATSLALWLPSPGVYDLRVRYTPFWRASDPVGVCIAPGSNGMTRLTASRGGPLTLQFDLTLGRSTSQALGTAAPVCAATPPNAVSARH
ncbi:MAG: hypothetical protein QOE98_2110 [Gaiellaceae bacterium]|nr:hypothetical protein [Gaiellaceae bacterium]